MKSWPGSARHKQVLSPKLLRLSMILAPNPAPNLTGFLTPMVAVLWSWKSFLWDAYASAETLLVNARCRY